MMRDLVLNDFVLLTFATRWTILLSLIAFVGGGFVGGIVAYGRISRAAPVRAISAGYIQVIQGTPLLIQLFIWYFGLSLVGTNLPPLVAAGIAVTLNSSAFFAEIWRGCLQAIPRPQWEAAASLALTRFQQSRYVIVPQAARIALAPTAGFMVQIIKNTSLTALVGFVELMRQGQMITNVTFEPLPIYLYAGAVYFALCFPLSALSRKLERKFNASRST